VSADNGVYILSTISEWKVSNGIWERRETPVKVYRIAHAQAIDNFDWYKKNQIYNLGVYMLQVWGESPIFETESEALLAAHKLAKEIRFLEYGINSIHTEYVFPTDSFL
jgi:hypothetical protein